MELTTLARACGKSNVHHLEREDLVALTVEAAAMARVPLAGTNWIPGLGSRRYSRHGGARWRTSTRTRTLALELFAHLGRRTGLLMARAPADRDHNEASRAALDRRKPPTWRGQSLERYLGNVIRELRQRDHLTIADVAAQAGISRGMLSKIETGQAATSLDTLVAHCAGAGRVAGAAVPRLRRCPPAARSW